MHLITRGASTFLIMIMIFTANTSFIFCCYIKSAVAEDITHSEYTSILSIGVGDTNPSISSSNNSSIAMATANDKGNTDNDIVQVTIIKGKSVHLMRFNFLQRLMDRFPRSTLLLYFLTQTSERWY